MATLVKTVETYEVSTVNEAKELIAEMNELKDVVASTTKLKLVKEKGEVIDTYYVVSITIQN